MLSTLADLAALRGWNALGAAYAAVQGPLLAGLWRVRAPWHRYLQSPLLTLPAMACAAFGTSLAAPLLRGWGLGATAGAGLLLSAAIGYAAGGVFGYGERRGGGHWRGSELRAQSPVRRLRSAPGRAAQRELRLAGCSVPELDETKHFKCIGTTGTGKSSAIAQLLDGALQRGDRAIIADPDGGYLRHFYDPKRGDVILNPFDARSPRWDLFGELRAGYDVEQLARAWLPDHEGSDRIWRGYGRTFFAAVTAQAHAAGVTDVAELYRLLVMAAPQELRTLTQGTPAQPFLDEHNERMFESVRSVTTSAVSALEYVAEQRASQFSIRDWVARRGDTGVLFMPYRAGQIAALRSSISAWMRLAIFEAMEHPEGDQRLWFVVDELDALGQIDGLKDALARLRKFGGRCVLGFQSIAQVATTYGAGEAHTIVENCGNTLLLRCSASEGGGTARFASSLIGQREVWRDSFSHNLGLTAQRTRSRSRQLQLEPAVLDSQIEQLPDLCGYLKFASQPYWSPVRLPRPNQTRTPTAVREVAAFVPAAPTHGVAAAAPARAATPREHGYGL